MKRVLASLLALLMLLSLVACGAEEVKTEEEKKTESAVETQEEEKSFSVPRGTVEGSVYSSEYSGLKIDLGSDTWSFASDEDLAAEMKITTDEIAGNLSNALAAVSTVLDVQANDSAIGSSFQVAYKVGKTADQYFASIKSELNSLSGVDYTVAEEGNATLCGQEYSKMILDCEAVGTTTTRAYFARISEDNLLICVEFNIFDTVETSAIEAMFVA